VQPGEHEARKKVLFLPGEHQSLVRQTGYLDFAEKIVGEPGQNVNIKLANDLRVVCSGIMARSEREIRRGSRPAESGKSCTSWVMTLPGSQRRIS
jgi:hypothetical protein